MLLEIKRKLRALMAQRSSNTMQRIVLINVRDGNNNLLATNTYGDSNERLIAEEFGQQTSVRTYYVGEGGATVAEYVENGSSTTPAWSKSYVYLGARLLSTLTPNGSGGEAIEYHHPDRLGTRLITNPATGGLSEQVTLPFGTALAAESSGTPSKRRFTSYDRSDATGLDYAVNRHYDPQQGRFTQVDPAGMGATSLESPQTLNLYAYCTNDPINHTDPSGLGFFSKLFHAIGKFLSNKWVRLIVGIALGALAGLGFIWVAQGMTQFLVPAILLAATSAILIVGAFHPNLLRVVGSINSVLGSIQGFAGLINGTINGGVFGTPPWDADAGSGIGPISNFQCKGRGCRRRIARGPKRLPIVAVSIDIATRQVTELTQPELDKINEEIKKEREYEKCVDDVESQLDHKVQRTHEKAIENSESIMYGGVSGVTITNPLVLIGTGMAILFGQRSLARDIESINKSRIAEIKKRCGTR